MKCQSKMLAILLFSTTLVGVPLARASCGKTQIEKLKFALASVHNAENENDNEWAKKQDEAGQRFCPNSFVVRTVPASEKNHAYRAIKWDFAIRGTDEDAALWIDKTLRSVLRDEHFETVPNDSEDTFEWRGPAGTWVVLHVNAEGEGDTPGELLCEIRVIIHPGMKRPWATNANGSK